MVHTNLVCITKFKGWSTSLHDDFDIAFESVYMGNLPSGPLGPAECLVPNNFLVNCETPTS